MYIFDSQVHIWNAGVPRPEHRQLANFPAEALLAEMKAAEVAKAVLVPPVWAGKDDSLVSSAAIAHPAHFAAMGRVSLRRPPDDLAHHCRSEGLSGLRLIFSQNLNGDWLDWDLRPLWSAAERKGIPIMLMASDFLPAIADLARAYPGLKIAIDHLGMVIGKTDAAAFEHIDHLLALSRHVNVAVKASALPRHSSEPYP